MEFSDRQLCDALVNWLPKQRWFAGKGRTIAEVRIVSRCDIPGVADCEHVVVAFDVGDWQIYQVPVVVRLGQQPSAVIAQTPLGPLVDAVTQGDVLRALLTWTDTDSRLDPDETPMHPQTQWLQQHAIPSEYRVLQVEQSNTSVVLGDSVLVKVFRMLRPGVNPDVEVHAALSATGCRDVGESFGWVNGGWREPESGQIVHGHLAMIQKYYPGSVDGGALAYRQMVEGFDFEEEAGALGSATARVHVALAQAFPTTTVTGSELLTIVDRLRARLASAARIVPEIAGLRPALMERFDRLSGVGAIRIQRVHGDLHLGQVLLTESGWRVLDFEGEPGGPFDARRAMDSPLRDIASMLRSFAYVASWGDGQSARRWADGAAKAFREGYEQVAGHEEGADVLLDAYTIDKAAYEAVYETRNRPDWVGIPMAALREMAGRR